MTEPSLKKLLHGVITRVEESAAEGVTVVVQTDAGSYLLRVRTCDCGRDCDLVQTTVERIGG